MPTLTRTSTRETTINRKIDDLISRSRTFRKWETLKDWFNFDVIETKDKFRVNTFFEDGFREVWITDLVMVRDAKIISETVAVTENGYIAGDRDAFEQGVHDFLKDRNYGSLSRREMKEKFTEIQRANKWGEFAPVAKVKESSKPRSLQERRDAFKRLMTNRKGVPQLPETLEEIVIKDHGRASSRTWGIEVEVPNPSGIDTPKGWTTHYDGSLRPVSGYNSYSADADDEEDWDDSDSDVRHDNADPIEFVSGILRSYHSRGLEQITEIAGSQEQNDSAGVHVHVGADDLTPKQIGALAFAYSIIEPILVPIYKRERRDFCKDMGSSDLDSIFSSVKSAQRATEVDAPDRYKTLNLQALSKHGTVEFRAMGPEYDYEYLIRWAQFCREMVNVAKAGVPQRFWMQARTFSDIIAIFAKYGKETEYDLSESLVDED